jgi:hypothetical protein
MGMVDWLVSRDEVGWSICWSVADGDGDSRLVGWSVGIMLVGLMVELVNC